MRSVLYWLGGRKFVTWVAATSTAGVGWYYGVISPQEALYAIIAATIAYMTANLVDGAIDAQKGKEATP